MDIINLKTCSSQTLLKVLKARDLKKSGKKHKEIAKSLNVHVRVIYRYLKSCEEYSEFIEELNSMGGTLQRPEHVKRKYGKGVKSYILTSAQNGTTVNEKLWDNIKAFAKYTKSEILITPMKYGGRRDSSEYDFRIREYLTTDRIELSPECVFYSDCSEFTRIAQNPLASLEYLLPKPHSGIFPSYKFAMETIAQNKHKSVKNPCTIHTTPTVTKMNYKNNKSGKIAENTMDYGAVFVQIDEDGIPYIFDLEASSDGDYSFCWLNYKVKNGVVTKDNRLETIVYGDIHAYYMDDEHINYITDTTKMLKPRSQVFHDVLDQYACNHHHVNNVLTNVRKTIEGSNILHKELEKTAAFFDRVHINDVITYTVESNHDDALNRYLDDKRSLTDFSNFWLNQNLQNVRMFMSRVGKEGDYDLTVPKKLIENELKIMNINVNNYMFFKRSNDLTPLLFEYVMKYFYDVNSDIVFLGVDDELDIYNNILQNHGDRGANGARGATSLRKTGQRMIIGHNHTPSRRGPLLTVGISFPSYKAGYAKGYSGWALTMAGLYDIGTSTLITRKKGKIYATNY